MKFTIDGENDKGIELTLDGLKSLYRLNINRIALCISAGFLFLFILAARIISLPLKDNFVYLIVEVLVMLGIILAFSFLYKKYYKVFQEDMSKQGIYDDVQVKHRSEDIVAIIVCSLIIVANIIALI